ncbi:glycosyltransferase [Myxococcota bacterium]|nr:glycosyltransferase [Myxococcota bacterium]
MAPPLAVVVPHHHREDLLPAALAAVARWPRVVIDDGPTGRPPVPVAPDVVCLRTAGDQGFARAVNLGLAYAETVLGAERVLLLNDDAVPEPGCVEALLAACGPRVGAVGPVLLGAQGIESAGVELARWGRVRQRTRAPLRVTEVGALSGACLLVPGWARLDPAFPHGFEDLALCRDLRARGLHNLVVPHARCRHLGGATLPRTTRRAQRHALAGHLRLVGGGWRGVVAVGLAVAQVAREGGPADRLLGIAEGLADGWWPRRPG